MTRRKLRQEEAELWQKVTHSTQPLPENIRNAYASDMARMLKQSRSKDAELEPLEKVFGVSAKAKKTAKPKTSVAASASMDRKQFGRMKRGKLIPEARIDLHGMTLDQAHPALARFILSSQARGLRLVLVITGKGKSQEHESFFLQPRGALKRQVPIWLRMAPLSSCILEVSEAHLRHGGGGAFYVYLRRLRK